MKADNTAAKMNSGELILQTSRLANERSMTHLLAQGQRCVLSAGEAMLAALVSLSQTLTNWFLRAKRLD
jgi:hypothetical protein